MCEEGSRTANKELEDDGRTVEKEFCIGKIGTVPCPVIFNRRDVTCRRPTVADNQTHQIY